MSSGFIGIFMGTLAALLGIMMIIRISKMQKKTEEKK